MHPLSVDLSLVCPDMEHALSLILQVSLCTRCLTTSSALNDQRFSPIEPGELHSLDVSVSLLVKYEPARHWEDWEVRNDAGSTPAAVKYYAQAS